MYSDGPRAAGVSLRGAVLGDAPEPLCGDAGSVDAYNQPIGLGHISPGLLPPADSG